MKKQPEPEWSFKIEAESIGTTPAKYHIKPSADQTAALSRRFGLLTLENLVADLVLERERGVVIHITGSLSADVAQSCVVTLEPVKAHIEDEFEAFFSDSQNTIPFARARADLKAKQGEPEHEMIDERDAPEPVAADGTIDLGELVAQYLSLAIDPYPRADGASPTAEEQETAIGESDRTEAANNPFAALKDWKDKL